MKGRLRGSLFPEERVGRAAVEEPFGSGGGRGAVLSQLPTAQSALAGISFLFFEQAWDQGKGSREESLGLPLAAEAKPGAGAASTFSAWLVALSALPPSPTPSPVGTGAGLVCQQTPMRCCFDGISQTFTDPIAGLAGKTTEKWQICMGHAEGVGAPPSSGTLTDRCCSLSCCRCWAQRPASFLHALNTFLLESQQGFYFPVGHFSTASAPTSPARAGCVPRSQVRGPTPGPGSGCSPPAWPLRADATEVSPLSLWSPPAFPVSCCHSGSPRAPHSAAGSPVTDHGQTHGWEVMGRGC